ncbi:hypothetical protein HMPREF9120_02624 [Neisseria sp. oral taxon 020 str. F0370]|nr:hypothetical protein HMPREF9120_02624 [Neisseria sp. oral taxon 020 str. F0370]
MKRIFRQKMADARQKCGAYAVHRRVFLTRQMPFYGGKAAKTLIVNTP